MSILAAKNLKLAVFIFKKWNIAPETLRSDVSTAHLCCDTSINWNWNRRKQIMQPKSIRKNEQKIIEYIVLHVKLMRRGSG